MGTRRLANVILIWSALAWQRFGLRSRRSSWGRNPFAGKHLDSQLSGKEKQAKAAPGLPGRRTPGTRRLANVILIWSALAWQRFGLRSRRSSWRRNPFAGKYLDSKLSGKEKQAKAAPGRRTAPGTRRLANVILIWSALAWQRFGLRSRWSSWGRNPFAGKHLDSQLSGKEKQAKAAPGRRTPGTRRLANVILIWSALAWQRFGLRSRRSSWGRN